MPRVLDIVRFLESLDALAGPALAATPDALERDVSRVAADERAGDGDLAWLSPRHHECAPDRVRDFAGALLLCPVGATQAPLGGGVALPCRTPKLAFTRVVNEFLAPLLGISWPSSVGGHAIAPDARLAADTELAPGVVIGPGVTIGAGSRVGPNSVLAHTSIGANVTIGANCTLGLSGFGYERDEAGHWWRFPHVGSIRIDDDVEIGSNTCIDRGALGTTIVRRGAKIDNLVHVAHNADIGHDAIVIAHAMVAGSTVIGDGAWLSPSVSVLNQRTVGAGAVVGMGAVVLKDVAPGTTVVGNPARPLERGGETR